MTLSIDELIEAARARIDRVEPANLAAEQAAAALVVDTRSVEQRERDGELPGAMCVDRNVLEWRLDPASTHRIDATGYDRRIIVVCNEAIAPAWRRRPSATSACAALPTSPAGFRPG